MLDQPIKNKFKIQEVILQLIINKFNIFISCLLIILLQGNDNIAKMNVKICDSEY